MQSKSPSKRWQSQTTMFGSIGRKKSSTWWSKFSFSHLVPIREMWLILRLTLLLSCSMKFSMYPFDEQHCHMSMESCKWRLVRFYQLSKHWLSAVVSHTTDDLIFEWYPVELIPLVVEPIQLPQLELIYNTTADCTSAYSTGADTVVLSYYIIQGKLFLILHDLSFTDKQE